jgi:hypothetical protein
MKAPYTTRASDLAPELLVADVPRDFGRLVIANGRAIGITFETVARVPYAAMPILEPP